MFRKQDFKKIDLLGSGIVYFGLTIFIGKKNTKIYKAEHIPTGKFYAIKEVEAKTLDKLNEYKVCPKTFESKRLNFHYEQLLIFIFTGRSSLVV